MISFQYTDNYVFITVHVLIIERAMCLHIFKFIRYDVQENNKVGRFVARFYYS